jgi:hypothetical protein
MMPGLDEARLEPFIRSAALQQPLSVLVDSRLLPTQTTAPSTHHSAPTESLTRATLSEPAVRWPDAP